MGDCMRPVIEQWGESVDMHMVHDDLTDLLQAVATEIESITSVAEYSDVERFWVNDGAKFLDYIRDHKDCPPVDGIALRPCCEQWETMRAAEPSWRKSIDPGDGSLRFYLD